MSEQNKQEPIVTKTEKGIVLHVGWDNLPAGTKLYTTPPAAPVQEPVAWGFFFEDGEASNELFDTREAAEKWLTSEDCLWAGSIRPLYTTPPAAPVQEQFGPQEILQMIVDRALEKPAAQRQWVGLTPEDEEVINRKVNHRGGGWRNMVREADAMLREKNGGDK